MTQLKYKNHIFNVSEGSTVLDTLLEQGQKVPNSCRAGACQSCIMQVTKGQVPEQAQKGLKDSHKAQGFFLACSCIPEQDINIRLPDTEQLRIPATVKEITHLSQDVIELTLKTSEPFSYHAGQYVTLWRDELLGRSYSIANLPQKDNLLRFHIRLITGGSFSSWAHNDLKTGEQIFVQGPAGDCFYTAGNPEQNLLLVGTGSGLAPLYGIVQDAIQNKHQGQIQLLHGALEPSGLYLCEELAKLSAEHENLHYTPCVLNAEDNMQGNILDGNITEATLKIVPKPTGWKTFLCGDEALVKVLRKKIFLAGGNMNDIYADAFISPASS